MLPVVFGFSSTELTAEEKAFFLRANPFGYILFQRNCENPAQVAALTATLRDVAGRDDVPILIDQEGGRVARLKPPHWPTLPAMRVIGALYEADHDLGAQAAILHSRITATMLIRLGITVNCTPVLDLQIADASTAIGDRAISADPDLVAGLARTYCAVHLEHGVMPIIKHFPGHGRVRVDPHYELPVINTDLETLRQADFVPFKALQTLPLGMTCHALMTALDSRNPVSQSAMIHETIIRGELGFGGLLISDDLAMEALQGSPANRAKRVLAAGTDIALHCNGKLAEMQAIADSLSPDEGQLARRWGMAQVSRIVHPAASDQEADLAALAELLGKSTLAS